MANLFWKVVNILTIITSLCCLGLQLIAVLVGCWKGQDIILSRFEPSLFNVYMHRRWGLFGSNIEVVNLNEDIVQPVSFSVTNRYPMVKGEILWNCINGPTLRHQLSSCDNEDRIDDCQCQRLKHWTAMTILELISLPLLSFLVICCFLLRTRSQRCLKSITLSICLISILVLLTGFILIFQMWDHEIGLLTLTLPYYIRTLMIEYNHQIPIQKGSLASFDKFYAIDNIHVYPEWSSFMSLGSLIGLVVLMLLLVISLIIDVRKTADKRKEGPPGTKMSNTTYRPVAQQNY